LILGNLSPTFKTPLDVSALADLGASTSFSSSAADLGFPDFAADFGAGFDAGLDFGLASAAGLALFDLGSSVGSSLESDLLVDL